MKNRLLVVVDYQKDFVDGSLGFAGAEKLEDGIIYEINVQMENDDPVIFTMDTHHRDYLTTQEGKNLQIEHTIKGTKGWDFYNKLKDKVREIKDKPNVIILEKETFGAIGLVDAFNYMIKNGYMNKDVEIRFCGVVTNICVVSCAVVSKAILPEAPIKIIKGLCGSNDKDMEQKAFDVMQNLQMEII